MRREHVSTETDRAVSDSASPAEGEVRVKRRSVGVRAVLEWLELLLERIGVLPRVPRGKLFDGFISYSHAADGRLAPALQKGLQRFTKPWYRARALHVFRDDESLSANPHLWTSIEQALDASRFFILLAAPQAASSRWVAREVGRWLETKSADTLLIAVTDGELVWDDAAHDFDWSRTTALPARLRGSFGEEPRYIDLRWARHELDLSLDRPRFRAAVTELAAPLHGLPKDQLASEEVLQNRRTVRIARAAVATLITLTVLAVGGGVLALIQRNQAIAQKRAAQSRELAARATQYVRNDFPLAALLSLEAYRVDHTADARNAIVTALQQPVRGVLWGHTHIVNDIAYSRDGKMLASVSDDGTTRLWDTVGQREIKRLSSGRADTVAIRPSGGVLATGQHGDAGNGTVRFWDIATRRAVGTFRDDAAILTVAFSPDGKTVAAGDDAGNVRLLDVPTGRPVGKPLPHPYWVLGLAFSPDGHLLATACRDGALRLWNPSTGRQVGRPFASRLAQANALAFNRDGTTLAAGYGNSDIALWDVKAHREIGSPQPAASGQVMSVAFAPDGKTLASAGDDGTVKFWRTADFGATFANHGLPAVTAPAAPVASTIAGSPSSSRTASLAGSSAVLSVDFSPDGRALAAGTVDGPVEIFDAPRAPHWAKPIARHSRSGRPRRQLAPEGTPAALTVSTTSSGPVTVSSTAPHQRNAILPRPFGNTRASDLTFAIAGDGKTIAAGNANSYDPNGTVKVLLLGNHDAKWRALPHPGPDEVLSLSFTPDGKTLAAGSSDDYSDHAARVWNLGAHDNIRDPATTVWSPPTTGAVASVRFSPDGRLLASADEHGVKLWNVATHSQLASTPLPFASLLAFTADSRTLAAAAPGHEGRGCQVQLFDGRTGARLGEPVAVYTASAYICDGYSYAPKPSDTLRFTSDGDLLLRSTVIPGVLTGTNERQVTETLCRSVGANLTRAEWQTYIPSQPYRTLCERYPTTR
jgi:WD40 repeat protein